MCSSGGSATAIDPDAAAGSALSCDSSEINQLLPAEPLFIAPSRRRGSAESYTTEAEEGGFARQYWRTARSVSLRMLCPGAVVSSPGIDQHGIANLARPAQTAR